MDNSKANTLCLIKKTLLLYCHCVKQNASCSTDSTIFWKTALLSSLILYLILHPYFENNASLLNTAQSSLNVILHIKDKGWRGQLEFIASVHQGKFSYPKKLCRTIRRNNFELKESHQEIIQTEKHTHKKVAHLTQHAHISQPTPRKKENGGSNYNFGSSALAQIPQPFRERRKYSVCKQQLHHNCSNNLGNLSPVCHLQLFCLKISLSIMGLLQQ